MPATLLAIFPQGASLLLAGLVTLVFVCVVALTPATSGCHDYCPPAAPHGEVIHPAARVRVYAAFDGREYWVGNQSGLKTVDELHAALVQAYRTHEGNPDLEFHAASEAPYEAVLSVVEAAQQAGIKRVLLMARREPWVPSFRHSPER
ncbi:MAG TPA: biopolymer transporter ExbD [Longimicrobiaceae bacterium]|nr:biopolymer transporter ExbD [Longimicrobiaceae bacterium]